MGSKLYTTLFLLILSFHQVSGQGSADSAMLKQIHNYSLENGKAYEWLRHICLNIGGRLAGSPEAEEAISYTHSVMDSIDNVNAYLQEVMVVNWKRGETEKCYTMTTEGRKEEFTICALGNSVGTPRGGITAEVIKVDDFEDLKKLNPDDVSGKIVFFNEPMDQKYIMTFNAYGHCGANRWHGPRDAASMGAIASINRSLTHITDDQPHTGSTVYNDSIPKIPGAAMSTLGADKLSRMIDQDPGMKLTLELDCRMLEDIPSSNVIGEITGSEFPEEIIVVGGHLDAWDNGQGAHDDGAGTVHSIEVLNIFNALGIKPKRTVRAVLFMNEENGLRGGKTYADQAKLKGEKHIAAIESDAGGFSPRGFFMDGDSVQINNVKRWIPLFKPYLIHDWDRKGSGADVSKLKDQGTLLMGLLPDTQRYFDYHHAPTDTFDKVNRRELQLGAAALASMVYLLSEHGVDLPDEKQDIFYTY